MLIPIGRKMNKMAEFVKWKDEPEEPKKDIVLNKRQITIGLGIFAIMMLLVALSILYFNLTTAQGCASGKEACTGNVVIAPYLVTIIKGLQQVQGSFIYIGGFLVAIIMVLLVLYFLTKPKNSPPLITVTKSSP